jgi:hypothetical protein
MFYNIFFYMPFVYICLHIIDFIYVFGLEVLHIVSGRVMSCAI